MWSLRIVAPEGSLRARAERLKAIKDEGQVTRSLMLARCDRGAEIALLLGLEPETADAIRALDEHWDGNGQPHGLRGEEIPLLARIVCLAQTAEIFHGEGGPAAAVRGRGAPQRRVVRPRARRGAARLPRRHALLGVARARRRLGVGARGPADDRRRRAPRPDRHGVRRRHRRQVPVDLPPLRPASPCSLRASPAALGADEAEVTDLRRAAMLHDIGKLAVSNRILDKPGPLTPAEVAQVREHPLITARILERIPGFAHLAPLAAAHHERLDGSGYPYGLRAENLTLPMRVLAVADVFEAVTSARPYRPAMSVEEALAHLRAEAPTRLDADAVEALAGILAPPEAAHLQA